MKKVILLVILAFSIALSPLVTNAATPKVINYQGKLEGVTSNTPTLVVFEIFEDAAGGSALWIEQKSVTVDNNGLFSVYLGDVNPIDLKFDKQYYLQVTVGNNQPFPRTKLTSTPSAFYAVDADTAQYAFNAGLAADVAPAAIGLDNLAAEVLTAGGDLTGMYPNPQIKPSAIIDNIPDGSITSRMLSPNISTSPSGPAGGDLTGTYPDPLIAVGAVKTDRIFDGAVTNAKIADGAVNDAKITDLDAAKLFNVSALDSRIAVSTDATIDGDGTLLSPLGLADNAVSTPKIVDGAVTNAKIAADAVTTDKILDGTILAADIATGAVTTDEILDETILATDIATGAVTTDEILDETILAADIATGAVTTDEILDETILANDIATGAVTTAEILNATILTEDLADDAVTNAKLADDAVRVNNIDVLGAAPVDGDVLYFDGLTNEMRWGQENVETSAPLTGDGTTANPVTLDPTFGSADELLIRTAPSGWVSSKINTANINDGAINSAKILDGTIATVDLADGSVTTAKLADNSVTTAKILDGEVNTADLADGSVTTAKLADNSVTTAKILDGEVNTADLADASVTTVKLSDNSVNGNKVIDGTLSSLDLNATGVTAGIYGDPSALPSTIDVPEIKVDAQGRILTAVENSYTVLAAGTIFNESPASDITVDGTYDNLDLQVKPGVIGTTEIADGGIQTIDLADGSVNSAKILDASVVTADLADNSVTTAKIADNNVLNTKIGSGVQPAGQVLKSDGAGNTVWGPDLGLILPYTGSYDGPGDAFTLTHTGTAGDGSVAVFTSGTNTNADPAVSITKDVAAGAGAALAVTGVGVQGTNYIATITNTNLNEGRTLLLENDAPVVAAEIVDPNAVPNDGDEFVNPDPLGTDVNDATLVVRNNDGATSNQKLAIKTYGSIQANSTIQGTNLVAYDGQITLYNSATGATGVILPPANPGDPINITPGLDINGTSTVGGLTNIWESTDGLLLPAGTGTDNDVPTALAVSNSIGSVAAEPFITFQADGGSLTNNRVFAVNSTLTKVIGGADNSNVDLGINLANPNTWTGTQTFSAAGNGLVATTDADFQANVVNTAGDVTVNDNLHVTGTSTLDLQTTVGGFGLGGNALDVQNNDAGVPTATFTNNNPGGPSINATGNVTVTAGGLNVTGNTDLNNDLNVDGTTTLNNTATITAGGLNVTGNTDLNNDLNVDGTTTLNNTATVTAGGLNVTGATDLNTGLNVDGATTLDNTTIDGTLTQNIGQVTLNGNVDANSGLDLVGIFGFDGETITNIDNTVEGLVSGDAGLPTSGNVAAAIAAVADAQFLTLANDPDLTNERAVTFTGNFTNTDNGANSTYDIDLSNTGVTAGSYGNNAGTHYSTFTVDAKGRLTAAATQIIAVNDAGGGDIDITGATSATLNLEIRANAVGTNELATADYSGDLAAGNYQLGNLDNTIIGAATPAAGTFTNLTAQTNFTLGAPARTADDIYISTDGVSPITGDDSDLITAGAVAGALAAFDLQDAYVNGNSITTSAVNGDVIIAGTENLDLGVDVVNSGGNVTVDDNLDVTGALTGVGATFTGNVEGATITEGGNAVPNVTEAPAAGDISGTYAAGLQIVANAVTPTEVAAGNYDADLTAGNYVLGNLDNTIIGAATPAAGTFTTLNATGNATVGGTLAVTGTTTATGLVTANGGLTVGAAQNFTLGGVATNDVYTSADGTNPIVGATDAQLITAKTVMDALTALDLQDAYVNGNTITTSAVEGDLTVAGTETMNVTTAGGLNVNTAGGLSVTGPTNLAGTLTQTGGGQVTFSGNVDANSGLDVVGGASVAGGVVVSTGGVAVTSGGVTVTAGGVTVNAGAVNLGPGGTTITGGGLMLTGNLETPGANPVNIADNLVVTGTSDLQGAVSNSVNTKVDINDGLAVNLQSAAEVVDINSATATGSLFNVTNTAVANNNYIAQFTTNGNSGVSITATGATAGGVALAIDNTNAGANNSTGIAVYTEGTSSNAAIVANNSEGTSSAFAVYVDEDGGNLKLSAKSATSVLATNGTITVDGNTVYRFTTAGVAANTVTLSAGTEVGQIIIVTNEDAGDINITTGTLGSVTVAAQTAAQLVWNGTTWVKLS